jgi:hypothetical protein
MFRNRSIKSRPVWATFTLLALCIGTAPAEAGRRPANQPPVISGTPSTTATVGTPYQFQPSAYDPEGMPVTFKISNMPAWATFNTTTGLLAGTPTMPGLTMAITISASDGKKQSSLNSFTIDVKSVAPVNHAPTISGTPATSVEAGKPYSFTPSASDADGDALSFSIANKPSWATFDTTTGTLNGTPTTAGSYANVTISVSDGKASASLSAFTISVTSPPVNRAPTISGTPVTSAEADRPYSFRPTASDPDGDALSFSISNKPSWATFDSTTGTLYGTPTAANVGSYPNVVIRVSDGALTSSLAAFAITVAAAPTKSVTLNWSAPTSNTDGTSLTDLAGYTVFYGNASRSYQTSVKVAGAGTTSVVLEGFEPGTWYFSIKSYNVGGVESDYSGEVTTVL